MVLLQAAIRSGTITGIMVSGTVNWLMSAKPDKAWPAGGEDASGEEKRGYRTKESSVSATVDAWVRKVAHAH